MSCYFSLVKLEKKNLNQLKNDKEVLYQLISCLKKLSNYSIQDLLSIGKE